MQFQRKPLATVHKNAVHNRCSPSTLFTRVHGVVCTQPKKWCSQSADVHKLKPRSSRIWSDQTQTLQRVFFRILVLHLGFAPWVGSLPWTGAATRRVAAKPDSRRDITRREGAMSVEATTPTTGTATPAVARTIVRRRRGRTVISAAAGRPPGHAPR